MYFFFLFLDQPLELNWGTYLCNMNKNHLFPKLKKLLCLNIYSFVIIIEVEALVSLVKN